jgi:hypothetical protein
MERKIRRIRASWRPHLIVAGPSVFNQTDAPMVHVLFEILPVDRSGPSLIPVQHR